MCWLIGPRKRRTTANGERSAYGFDFPENWRSCRLTLKPATTPLPIRSPAPPSRASRTPGAKFVATILAGAPLTPATTYLCRLASQLGKVRVVCLGVRGPPEPVFRSDVGG